MGELLRSAVGIGRMHVLWALALTAWVSFPSAASETTNESGDSPIPPVQVLIPGFEAIEIPIELTNVNNVRYRRDGKLVTLGYNGDIHLLSDSDADGLEDTRTVFWKNDGGIRGPIGMALTPEEYSQGQGVIVASKGKVSMIVDRDGDDRGDEELVIASGWPELPHNVDTVGLAMASDGSIYFGIGTTNFANAYLLDEKGQSHYDIFSQRGTVQRIAPDWQTRETLVTGIRFPIGIAFNELGDLFCTEQEGATWLPNGNALDALLHLPLTPEAPKSNPTGKRHFGFPPRHPRHNPNVIDEPPMLEFGPQHQSTCGMFFNLPATGGTSFGPEHWRGDAIVCGESRGKIWRAKLVKTHVGYVAESQLIACLNMLTVDACLAPSGDLVVACHSGLPDWGTGPQGIGKLFKIRMSQPQTPRPVSAWAASPGEIHIAFDRPLDPTTLNGMAQRARVEVGQYARAGDRFETLSPPYAVVELQKQQPRSSLTVHGSALSSDRHSLVLYTDPIRQPVHHAMTLPIGGQSLDMDLVPRGVAVHWQSENSSDTDSWTGQIPHWDISVSRSLRKGSMEHESLWGCLQRPGKLSLQTVVDVRDMLRPAVQIGEVLDYEWPPETVFLNLTSSSDSQIIVEVLNDSNGDLAEQILVQPSSLSPLIADAVRPETVKCSMATIPASKRGLVRVKMVVPTGPHWVPTNSLDFHTQEDETRRAIGIDRFWLPWLVPQSPSATPQPARSRSVPELAGGSWGNGRRLFHEDRALCSRCHTVGPDGIRLGPDLGNLVHRDYASVLRDILHPSLAINPDYLGHSILTTDGQVLTGVVRSEGEDLVIGDAKGQSRRVPLRTVEQMEPMSTSVMPVGLLDQLTASERRDLLTYLLSEPPSMPTDSPLEAPSIRTQAEVVAALAGSQPIERPMRNLNIVLVDGVKDHGPGEHDYPAWQRVWLELLRSAENVDISTARDFPSVDQLEQADVAIFFQRGSFSLRPATQLDAFLKRGGGVVLIHWAVNADHLAAEFAQRIGLASWGGKIKYRHGPLVLDITAPKHPIMRNFDRLQLYDESYWKLSGDAKQVTVLATSREDEEDTPQIWVKDHQPGRVFVSIPGHYSWTFDDPLFRILLLRGIAWTAGEQVDRFNELATPGARVRN